MNTKDKTEYPDWVERHHTKGTSIKKIRDNYYLYKVTSFYSKEKSYPISSQTYIGKIDKEKGLIKPESISFTPGKDEILLFKDVFSLKHMNSAERKIIENIPIIFISGICYTGKLDKRSVSLLRKYYTYEEGIVSK